MYDGTSTKLILRSQQEIRALLGDFELVEPGMSWTPSWRPEEDRPNSPVVSFATPNESAGWAGVGRKP
jgi:hypothetical protein